MTRAILGVLLLAAFVMTGCAGLPVNGLKTGSVSITVDDQITSVEEAKEAVGLLRDNHAFPYTGIEDVEIGEHTVTLKGYKSTVEQSEGGGYIFNVPRTTFALAKSFGFTTLSETRNQVSIWLSDVQAVTLEHVEEFAQPQEESSGLGDEDIVRVSGDLTQVSGGYLCHLRLKDNEIVSFYSPDESYMKRVALGFGFLTGKTPVEDELNSVGIFLGTSFTPGLDRSADYIQQIRISGPADNAGVPLGEAVAAIDGVNTSGDEATDQTSLDHLGSGYHTIKTRDIGSLWGGQTWTLVVP